MRKLPRSELKDTPQIPHCAHQAAWNKRWWSTGSEGQGQLFQAWVTDTGRARPLSGAAAGVLMWLPLQQERGLPTRSFHEPQCDISKASCGPQHHVLGSFNTDSQLKANGVSRARAGMTRLSSLHTRLLEVSRWPSTNGKDNPTLHSWPCAGSLQSSTLGTDHRQSPWLDSQPLLPTESQIST